MFHLPPAVPREQAHTRQITFRGYFREDGLWDIEAELTDVKPYLCIADGANVNAGEPIHGMAIRLTIDDDMIVKEIIPVMEQRPFEECTLVLGPMHSIIGFKMGPGWRAAVDKAVGGTNGCTHMREMLYNAATAAYQMIESHKEHLLRKEGKPIPAVVSPPAHLGKCMSWAFDGPVMKRHLPQFYAPKDPPTSD